MTSAPATSDPFMLKPAGLPAPLGLYSHASQVAPGSELVFVAGQLAVGADGQIVGPGDFEAQARQAFANLRAVLEDAGSSLDRVVKVTCYLPDASAFAVLNALFAELFPIAPPVRSAPIVQLPRGLLFSVDAIAVVNND